RAIPPALLLLVLGAICAVLAHRLSLREARAPVESGTARAGRRSAPGWRLPLLPESVSAVLEKEARTVLRIGWLQIVLVPIGFFAHLATFPLLALIGNLASVLWPVPVRGVRLRRVRGSGPVGSRLGALAALGAAAWAPWAAARLTGLPLAVAYLGEAVAMAVAYGGVLAVSAHLLEARREPLLAALATDE